jgi:hypothetical protein
VLAWRLSRQLLEPVGERSVADVVGRLCGVQAQVASSAELAIRVRQQRSHVGEVETALRDGALIKTWAMRGALHLLTAGDAGAFLALMATARVWERQSWQRVYGASPADLDRLRDRVVVALDGATLTREALIEAIVADRQLAKLGDELRSGWGMLLKPLAWQGALCYGPSQGTRVTFRHPKDASRAWTGLPDVETGARVAIAAYLGAYGPATSDAFSGWLSGGWFGKRVLRGWFESLGDELAEVDVEGQLAYLRAADLDDLVAATPSTAVRLLPGFDQYVLGPGTADGHVTPVARRASVSRQSGWIAPVVVAGGVVAGTWSLDGDRATITWFAESGRVPTKAIRAEVERMASLLGRELTLVIAKG